MGKIFFTYSLALLFCFNANSQQCTKQRNVFDSGESATYLCSYNWGLIWVNAGEVTFSTQLEELGNKPVYHLIGEGGTFPKYDWIYKVRDKYETWSDTTTLFTKMYIRDVSEGGTDKMNVYKTQGDSVFMQRTVKSKTAYDTLVLNNNCTYDVLSLIYYCRSIDFSSYNLNEEIPLTILLDNATHPTFLKYQGKEQVKLENGKMYNTLKFSALLVEGSIFAGGEDMTVWVSDDDNRLPIKVEAEILVGKVLAQLSSYKELKYKFTSKVE